MNLIQNLAFLMLRNVGCMMGILKILLERIGHVEYN